MIRPAENAPALLEARCAAVPHPGLLAALWRQAFGGMPGQLAVYDCGGGLVLAVHGQTGVLLGRPAAAQRRELAAFLPFAGIRTLYTADRCRFLSGSARQLVWMSAPAAPGDPQPPADACGPFARLQPADTDTGAALQQSYAAAAALICDGLPQSACGDFYADLCTRRNRGLAAVLRLGPDAAPTACLVGSGPVALPFAPAPNSAPAALLRRVLGGLVPKKRPSAEQPSGGPAAAGQAVYLSDVTVRPQCRGAGLGRALLSAAAAAAPAHSRLYVYCSPAMTGYYAPLGYRAGGVLWRREL